MITTLDIILGAFIFINLGVIAIALRVWLTKENEDEDKHNSKN